MTADPPVTLPAHEALQLAFAHHEAGRLNEAEHIYQAIVQAAPSLVDARSLLGVLQYQTGRAEQGLENLRAALAIDPRSEAGHNNLGFVYMDQRRYAEAAACFGTAVELNPQLPKALANLANALRMSGQLDESWAACERLLRHEPKDVASLIAAGATLQELGRLPEALEHYTRAANLQPGHGGAHYNIGNVLRLQGRLDESLAHCREAVRLEPSNADALTNLGAALTAAGHVAEATALFRRAIELKPTHLEALNNLAAVLIHARRFDEALTCHERGLRVDPASAYLHWSRALAWLTLGDFERGWPEFEWRLKWNPKKLARDFAQPQWDGGDLAGRTILIHAEGGFGDAIQFVRFAPWVKRYGGRVVLECQPELVSLLATVEGIDEVVARGLSPLPAFDVHSALQSLPAVLRLRFDQIPASIPYLAVDAERVAAARKRVEGDGAQLRVGLVWSGSAKPQRINNPNLALSAFAALAEVSGVVFYGLQKGEPAREAMTPPAGATFVDVGPSLTDFAETAAFVEALDLVITVDTSTAHLAGALGRPVWVLLAYSPDFRWLVERGDSPWYPTMRLVRQPELGDWASVFAQVTGALRQLATTGVQRSGDSG